MSHSRDSAQLPIPDYDALQLGDLLSHVQTLDEEQLAAVLEYERQHANRVGVLTAAEVRLHQLQAGSGPSPDTAR